MTVPIPGLIADSITVDTESANATAVYPLLLHGGLNKTYLTIYSGGVLITGLDPSSQPIPVPGVPINILVPPLPPLLPRTSPIVGIVNLEARGVYFEKTLVPVIGDGVTGVGALPNPRPLTTPGKYPTIYIGTRT